MDNLFEWLLIVIGCTVLFKLGLGLLGLSFIAIDKIIRQVIKTKWILLIIVTLVLLYFNHQEIYNWYQKQYWIK